MISKWLIFSLPLLDPVHTGGPLINPARAGL